MQASASQDTTLPRAVRVNVERIRAKVAARGNNPNPNLTGELTPPEPVELAPSEEAPKPEVAVAQPVETSAAPVEQADPRHSDPKYWEMRYRTEVGMHKSTKRAQAAETEGLRQQIVDLQEKLKTARASAAPEPINVEEFFTPEEVEAYGREQCEVMVRTSKRIAEKQAREAVTEAVEPLKQQTTQARSNAVADEAEAFRRELTKIVPDWAAIDESQRWLDWLEEPDMETGVQYGAILNHHVHAHNAQAAAKVFQKYKRTLQMPVPPVAPNGSAAAPTLETPPNPTAASGNPQGLQPLRPGEARDFYKRAAMGKVTDSERAAFEARLKLTRS